MRTEPGAAGFLVEITPGKRGCESHGGREDFEINER